MAGSIGVANIFLEGRHPLKTHYHFIVRNLGVFLYFRGFLCAVNGHANSILNWLCKLNFSRIPFTAEKCIRSRKEKSELTFTHTHWREGGDGQQVMTGGQCERTIHLWVGTWLIEDQKTKEKFYDPFLWMGFNCLKAISRRQFTFYH